MDDFQQWLAEMPVAGVRQRIAQLERELEILRLLEKQHREAKPSVAPKAPEAPPVAHSSAKGKVRLRPRAMSPQRVAIREIVRAHPEGIGPAQVASEMRRRGTEISDNAAQTNMSRMVERGMLIRAEQGLYKLPYPKAEAGSSNGADPGHEQVVMTP